MKLEKTNRNRWSVTFSVMFAVQLLASSLCISTAVQAAEVAANHCHESSTHAEMSRSDMSSENMQQEKNVIDHSMASACTHCASPDDFSVSINSLDHSPVMFLLAYMTTELAASKASAAPFTERAQAPPQSSTTLYTTTQRILI